MPRKRKETKRVILNLDEQMKHIFKQGRPNEIRCGECDLLIGGYIGETIVYYFDYHIDNCEDDEVPDFCPTCERDIKINKIINE